MKGNVNWVAFDDMMKSIQLPSNGLQLLLGLQLGLGNKCPGLQLAALIARFLMIAQFKEKDVKRQTKKDKKKR